MAQIPDEPLTLTVHSLPRADAADPAALTRAGRWKMLLLLLVCASPVVASYFTYYVIRPEGRRNYGELIDPQRPLPDLVGTDVAGRAVNLRQLKDQWLFISVADSACDDACQKHLYLQHQLRETLGKDKDRLDWVWLRTGPSELSEPLKKATATANVLRVDAAALASWLTPAAGHRLEDHLYVVDPIGNWMMRFPADADSKQVKRDLDRLMRASAFWDKGGRPAPAAGG
ncbi:SCO family protein [Hydrogenophaga sp. RWCD_12]|uniref:SCO family protein n=1 Tax=Hydrogenophaga sp. RWCD_12 TaxID=3391190 RepID=UPI0039854E4E